MTTDLSHRRTACSCGAALPEPKGRGRRRQMCDDCLYKARLERARIYARARHARLKEAVQR